MSHVFIASLYYARKQIGLYFGIPVFIVSVVGEFFSIVVLLSLKTFRQNSCGFYLLTMSIFNLIRLSLSTVFIIISLSFGIDYSVSMFFFCQLRNLIATTCNTGSISCLCMAVIDQYFATCSRPRWQQWSNIKVAHRMIAIITLIWTLHSIPYFILFDKVSPTNTAVCVPTNSIFLQYHTFGYFLTYNSVLPLIAIVFSLMAFVNVRQVAVYVCTYVEYSVVSAISAINTDRDPVYLAKMNLANAVTLIVSVYSNGSSFYTYVCVSQRFRRQFLYVLYRMYVVRCYNNQVTPSNTEA
ncbi:unnamed protein product [Adineta ricciae]|uniref:G-protein coupled receptors family 1 profile domain-containing protein n=1 Tax=Adineta ricciae TaxID=249248 RepID=A0A814Z8N3_ADIRI|nr:unnamed protein product [Adineta ricciae]CAF1443067.1 unnamed protein product [Adineta ricciae]